MGVRPHRCRGIIAVRRAIFATRHGPWPSFLLQLARSDHKLPSMFDTITAEITTASDKLSHLRRFL